MGHCNPFRMRIRKLNKTSKGFTLVEMLVVISIIALLAGVLLANLDSAQQKAQDAKRIADVKQIEIALRLYYDHNYSTYPEETTTGTEYQAGWEVSFYPNFMEYLDQYIPTRIPKDPINSGPTTNMFAPRPDGTFYYAYYKYWAGYGSDVGCTWNRPFAVLGFRSLERPTTNRIPLSKARCGTTTPCPGAGIHGGGPTACRDWSNEFDYSVFLID